MKNYFECTIKRDKILENGMEKKVTETYLVDAMSFTESESRIIENLQEYISGDFQVKSIKRAGYGELLRSDETAADRYFKCKLILITLDEKSGAEKRTSDTILVQASDLRDAVKKIDAGMNGTIADYEIASVAQTSILEVIDHNPWKQ